MLTIIQSSAILLLLTIICNGYQLPVVLQREEELSSDENDHILKKRNIESTTEPGPESDQLQGILENLKNAPQEEKSSTDLPLDSDEATVAPFQNGMDETTEISDEIKSRIDKGPVQIIEERLSKAEKSEGFTDGPNFNPDRTGILFGLLPFFGGNRPTAGRSHRPSYSFPPRPPSSNYHPTHPYKQSHHPTPQHIPKYPYKPYEHDYDSPTPDPLPPFPPDGPIFSEYSEELPGNSPPHFPEYDSEDFQFEIPEKPQYISDLKGFDDGFDFDFDPPDFFEHSGIPYPPNEDYQLQHDEPYFGGGGGHVYPMKPYSDDDEFEFFPPESYNGFIPTVYKGPPKPVKHIPPGPKPGPPLPRPHKFMHPPDLNIIVEENIYRDDVPYKEVHNERDKITDELDEAGINGLDPETVKFIHTHTRPYVESNHESDDHWKRSGE
ncbi:uncharacterized protein LOC135218446 [Macrobrachium nipponense]|uniref:uncharacterized protein LOC135218446 n=1 Tax=Macrobrachium nipponense TaxID=159736 RepID=UPI0030C809CC